MRSICNGLETMSSRGCRLLQALPNDINRSETLSGLEKNAIVDYVSLRCDLYGGEKFEEVAPQTNIM